MNKITFFRTQSISDLKELNIIPKEEEFDIKKILEERFTDLFLHQIHLSGTLSSFIIFNTNGHDFVIKRHIIDEQSMIDAIKHYVIFEQIYETKCTFGFFLRNNFQFYSYCELLSNSTKLSVEDLLKLIKEYHYKSIIFNNKKSIINNIVSSQIQNNFDTYFEKLLKNDIYDYIDEIYKSKLLAKELFLNIQNILRVSTEYLLNLERGLCHGDLNNNNVLFKDNFPIIIDWEDAFIGPKMYDFAFCLSFYENLVYLDNIEKLIEPKEQKAFWLLYLIIVIKKSFLRFLKLDYLTDKLSIQDRIKLPVQMLLKNEDSYTT